ncbi:MAG: hypothetical protein EOO38_08135 [Cytophagaceae bacterium]|nr:MAG: hypothetical protein EOO38_08135 [Cytophagaceae bacterium]
MRFRIAVAENDGTLEIPTGTIFGGAVLVAIISALTTLITNLVVDLTKVRSTLRPQDQAHSLAIKRFQFEAIDRLYKSDRTTPGSIASAIGGRSGSGSTEGNT